MLELVLLTSKILLAKNALFYCLTAPRWDAYILTIAEKYLSQIIRFNASQCSSSANF